MGRARSAGPARLRRVARRARPWPCREERLGGVWAEGAPAARASLTCRGGLLTTGRPGELPVGQGGATMAPEGWPWSPHRTRDPGGGRRRGARPAGRHPRPASSTACAASPWLPLRGERRGRGLSRSPARRVLSSSRALARGDCHRWAPNGTRGTPTRPLNVRGVPGAGRAVTGLPEGAPGAPGPLPRPSCCPQAPEGPVGLVSHHSAGPGQSTKQDGAPRRALLAGTSPQHPVLACRRAEGTRRWGSGWQGRKGAAGAGETRPCPPTVAGNTGAGQAASPGKVFTQTLACSSACLPRPRPHAPGALGGQGAEIATRRRHRGGLCFGP